MEGCCFLIQVYSCYTCKVLAPPHNASLRCESKPPQARVPFTCRGLYKVADRRKHGFPSESTQELIFVDPQTHILNIYPEQCRNFLFFIFLEQSCQEFISLIFSRNQMLALLTFCVTDAHLHLSLLHLSLDAICCCFLRFLR